MSSEDDQGAQSGSFQEKAVLNCARLLRSTLIFGSATWGLLYIKEFGSSLSWVPGRETKPLELPNCQECLCYSW